MKQDTFAPAFEVSNTLVGAIMLAACRVIPLDTEPLTCVSRSGVGVQGESGEGLGRCKENEDDI